MRDAILRAAADLFAEHGADNVSFDEIAATAGITAPQLRAYFTSTTGVHNALDQEKGARDVRTHHPRLVA